MKITKKMEERFGNITQVKSLDEIEAGNTYLRFNKDYVEIMQPVSVTKNGEAKLGSGTYSKGKYDQETFEPVQGKLEGQTITTNEVNDGLVYKLVI